MKNIRRIAAATGILLSTLLSFWAGGKAMLDLIGRALTVEDFAKPDGLVARGALWLFGTPWWVPGVLATLAVLGVFLLIYLGLRKPDVVSITSSNDAWSRSRIEQQFPTTDWDKPLIDIFRQHYRNETVQLDGKNFIECIFENVTFAYQGMRPIQMINCTKIPEEGFLVTVKTDNPVVFTAL